MTQFLANNQITLLHNGADYFPALAAAIDAAKGEVYLQSYIFEDDKAGKFIANALKNAAKRSVKVNVLFDGFGCKDLPPAFIRSLKQSGVDVMIYSQKISPWSLKKSRLRRMHRKLAVIDGKVGFVGGINIIDDYNVPDNTPPRIDYALQIEGSLLPAMLISVQKLWRRSKRNRLQLSNLSADTFKVITKKSTNNTQKSHNVTAAFVLRDNLLHRRDIENAYLTAIRNAKSEIIIANAYFVPGRKFRKALLAAAKRGVNIKLLLQGRVEYFLMFATHAFYSIFLKYGIEIYEYRKGFMHSKVAVIDNEWATVGSSNIDPFSLLLAREANVIVQDKAFANELRADIMQSILNGTFQVEAEDWAKGHFVRRFASWLAFGLVRLFVGLIGYSKEQ